MKNNRSLSWTFEKYKNKNSKVLCPNCGKKTFTRLINIETHRLLPLPYGRCSRLIKCAFAKYPSRNEEIKATEEISTIKEKKEYFNILPQKILYKSLINKYQDNFSRWCINTFGEKVKKSLDEYLIGCYGKYCNTIFWQLDEQSRIRSGKIMQYDIKTGKRSKNFTTWVHSLLKIENYSLEQIFFGAHLINKYPDKKICVVEGEKNAVVLSALYPNFLWLAAGQLYGLSDHKLASLSGKNVVFYPDKGERGFNIWKNRLQKSNFDFKYQISEVLERRDDLKIGDDLVDMILKDKSYLQKNLVV